MKDSARTAAIYDFMMRALDHLIIKGWRKKLWAKVKGSQVLLLKASTVRSN